VGSRNATYAFLDKDRFPGFAINHFLHNIVTSLLAFPDSISPPDQILTNLALRPYWVERNPWAGELESVQATFMLINLALLSLGISWAWKRWRWAGMVPLFIYLVYLASLGLARTSGSRYIVPIDWVFFFYFAIGIVLIFEQFANLLKMKNQGEFGPSAEATPPAGGRKKPWLISGLLIFLFCIAASIPVADNLIPLDHSLCEDESYLTSIASIYGGELASVWVPVGRVLYPALKDGTMSFTLLTCEDTVPYTIQDFEGELNSGQQVIMVVQFPITEQKIDLIASYEQGNAEIVWDNR
jgi:hypothetical protein